MKKMFKKSNTLRQKQYRALIEFELFHDEIMECLAESQYDFEIAIYKLLQIKMDRASQMHVLCTTFAHEQVIYVMKNSEDWFEGSQHFDTRTKRKIKQDRGSKSWGWQGGGQPSAFLKFFLTTAGGRFGACLLFRLASV